MKEKSLRLCVLSFLILLILQFILSFVVYYILDSKSNLIITTSIDLSFVIVLLWLTYFWKIRLFNDASTPTIKLILLTIFIGVAFVLITPLFYLTDFIKNLNNNIIGFNTSFKNRFISSNSIDLYYNFRAILIMPILEELYYRRIIQKIISKKYNSVIAILISSLLFSLGHMDIEQILIAFISGIILGYFYLKTKNIIMPILLHSLFNILILISKEKIVYLEGPNYFYLIIYPIAIYLIIYLTKKALKTSS